MGDAAGQRQDAIADQPPRSLEAVRAGNARDQHRIADRRLGLDRARDHRAERAGIIGVLEAGGIDPRMIHQISDAIVPAEQLRQRNRRFRIVLLGVTPVEHQIGHRPLNKRGLPFFPRSFEQRAQRRIQPVECALRIDPPVGRPDADQIPAETAQNALAHLVAIPRRRGTAIGGPVAFDTREKIARPIGVDDAEIDPEA